MSVAIEVENLSKAYQIGQIGTGTISRDIERWFVTRVMGREDPFLKLGEVNDRNTKSESNVVWSLKDINLEIEQGDAIGIIGRNGAGKSTLLKLLSRVTAPTTGRIKIKGRVASLLEVGTGFHQELTGRENIYLNGSILGMRKREIDRKLDEIVNFSGVERYIDTPVKRYSSGMSVRLAFSVAAHLESEILIIDEVLAVGDAVFQRKCLTKMREIATKGRTVLFVSHNLGSITELCESGIVLDRGQVAFTGGAVEAVAFYTESAFHYAADISLDKRWDGITFSTSRGTQNQVIPLIGNDGFRVETGIKLDVDYASGRISCIVRDASGNFVINDGLELDKSGGDRFDRGQCRLNLDFPALWLAPGVYTLCFKFVGQRPSGAADKYISERVVFESVGGSHGSIRAVLAPTIDWKVTNTVRKEFARASSAVESAGIE